MLLVLHSDGLILSDVVPAKSMALPKPLFLQYYLISCFECIGGMRASLIQSC